MKRADDITYEQLLAVFNAAGTNGDGDDDNWPPTPLVDWAAAYGQTENPALWLTEPFLPAASSVAMYAKGGTGKSLLALWLAAGLATGNTLTGRAEPLEVLYLDYEMTVDNVVERLEDMGYDHPDLEHLHYASLPSLAPLDTVEGGKAVLWMAKRLGVSLVVIDTFGRAVNGDENEADTVRAWYRWTGQLLKATGIAFLRIDHAGKDAKKGQRGSSAKNDDVDVVWEMTAREGGWQMRATKRRFSWVEESVTLTQTRDNGILGYRWRDDGVTYWQGSKEVADLLDSLDAPVDISRRKAMELLRSVGDGRANNVVADALKYRRKVVLDLLERPSTETPPVPLAGSDTKPQVVPPKYHGVPPDEPMGQVVGTTSVVPPAPGPDPDPLADF